MRLRAWLVAGLLTVAPAMAQDDPTACWTRVEGQTPVNTFFDKQRTDAWRQMLQQANGELMGQLAGTYYGERASPDGVYYNRQYRSYEPSGLFQYQDETCGTAPGSICSQNQGTGEWRAVQQGDGSVYLMNRFSDLIVTAACSGERVQPAANGFTDETGIFWQRTQ